MSKHVSWGPLYVYEIQPDPMSRDTSTSTSPSINIKNVNVEMDDCNLSRFMDRFSLVEPYLTLRVFDTDHQYNLPLVDNKVVFDKSVAVEGKVWVELLVTNDKIDQSTETDEILYSYTCFDTLELADETRVELYDNIANLRLTVDC